MVKEGQSKEEVKKVCDNSFGVASVILGIMGIVSYGPGIPIILGIIGWVFANKQKKIMKNKWVMAGKILSIISIILGIIGIILFSIAIYNDPNFIKALQEAKSA